MDSNNDWKKNLINLFEEWQINCRNDETFGPNSMPIDRNVTETRNSFSNGIIRSSTSPSRDSSDAFTQPPNHRVDPIGRPIVNSSATEPKHWYNQFVVDTQRYPRGAVGKSQKHVHWEDEPKEQLSNGANGMSSGREWQSQYGIFSTLIQDTAAIWSKETDYQIDQMAKNMEEFDKKMEPLNLLPDPVWSFPKDPNDAFLRFNAPTPQDTVNRMQQMVDNIKVQSNRAPASYTWSGQLPRRSRSRTPIYSCKVFLGGIPYDLTDSDLHLTFAQFGHIQIQWPGKDIKSAIDGAAANKAGYVYIIFESYDNVTALLSHCTVCYRDMDSGIRWYYNISSRRQKGKEVQVIPFDIGDRFYMKNSFSGQMEHSRTVFVGALHGMLSADGLAKVMDDLFGGVVFAGLDTDKYKYPLGSGRVSFDNQESYMKAIAAAFVEIKSARFRKKIQIDPYIESEMTCTMCGMGQNSSIFCRDEFLYFCAQCWPLHHSDPESTKHRPIVKNKPNP